MKKIFIAIIGLLFLAANETFAYSLTYFSNDDKILSALRVLKQVGAEEVFDNLMEVGAKIQFYDLTMLDFNYSKHYAVSSYNTFGDRYILINTRYMNSPKEALACLIAHESFHKLKTATMAEEVKCTQKEAEYWHRLKYLVPENSTRNDLVDRLDRLEHLYLASDPQRNRIAESIQNNSFYRMQLASNSR